MVGIFVFVVLDSVPYDPESGSFGKQADPRFLHFNPPTTRREACLPIPDISDLGVLTT
jgi:hypothetical protein